MTFIAEDLEMNALQFISLIYSLYLFCIYFNTIRQIPYVYILKETSFNLMESVFINIINLIFHINIHCLFVSSLIIYLGLIKFKIFNWIFRINNRKILILTIFCLESFIFLKWLTEVIKCIVF